MTPLSGSAFANALRDADDATRAAFVAALYDARGWDASVEDGVVVAERSGDVAYDGETRRSTETERIGVVDPGRFGTPDVDGLDALATARDREGVREACEAAGVEYLGPDALRDRLLYGLDRDVAADLFETHFDRPLAAASDDASSGALEVLPGGPPGTGAVAVALLLLLVVGAAVAGPGFSFPTGNAGPPSYAGNYTPGDVGAVGGEVTTTPSPTPTPVPPGPPGLGPTGVVDAEALSVAHFEAVTNRSYVLRVAATGPSNLTVNGQYTPWNLSIQVESVGHYNYSLRAATGPGYSGEGTVKTDLYAVDGVTFFRQGVGDDIGYDQYPTDTVGVVQAVTSSVRGSVERYLRTTESSVRCVEPAASFDACDRYNVTATGEPVALLREVADYRAVAIVDDSGLVRSLTVTYTVPDADGDGERDRVRYRFEYVAVGDAEVTPPAWLDEARNATDGNETVTESG